MTRLNQSRRGLIGYTYSPQVCNDVAVSTGSRQMSVVQEQAFEQSMAGDGRLRDIVRGILSKRHLIVKHGPKVIDAVVKGIQFMNTDEGKQLKQDFSKIAPKQSERIDNIVNKYTPPEKYQNVATNIYKGVKAVQGQGIGLAGAGIGLAGAGDTLPGDILKKKLLKKMIREKKMKSLGDRVKTSPVVAGFNGGSMVIPTRSRGSTSSGQSKSKGLGKGYKLNPKPLVGGFIFSLAAIIAGISAAASAAAATTVVGTVTVGALTGAALTGAAGAAGAKIINAMGGDGVAGKDVLAKVIKETKLTLSDLPTDAKIKLKAGFEALKKNPTKEGIIALGKKMAPVARDVMKKKLAKKINKITGSGIGLAGQGLGLAGGSQAKKFDNSFVKNFTKTLTT